MENLILYKKAYNEIEKYALDYNKNMLEEISKNASWQAVSEYFNISLIPQKLFDICVNGEDKDYYNLLCGFGHHFKLIGRNVMSRPYIDRYSDMTAGFNLSDPDDNILGVFNIFDGIVTYNPYDKSKRVISSAYRRVLSFDDFYTTITFDDLIKNQIEHARLFYLDEGEVFTGQVIKVPCGRRYKKVTKADMLEFATNKEYSREIFSQYPADCFPQVCTASGPETRYKAMQKYLKNNSE